VLVAVPNIRSRLSSSTTSTSLQIGKLKRSIYFTGRTCANLAMRKDAEALISNFAKTRIQQHSKA